LEINDYECLRKLSIARGVEESNTRRSVSNNVLPLLSHSNELCDAGWETAVLSLESFLIEDANDSRLTVMLVLRAHSADLGLR
jgi:hypothetical protein